MIPERVRKLLNEDEIVDITSKLKAIKNPDLRDSIERLMILKPNLFVERYRKFQCLICTLKNKLCFRHKLLKILVNKERGEIARLRPWIRVQIFDDSILIHFFRDYTLKVSKNSRYFIENAKIVDAEIVSENSGVVIAQVWDKRIVLDIKTKWISQRRV